jgi:hypothetical protein
MDRLTVVPVIPLAWSKAMKTAMSARPFVLPVRAFIVS